MGYKDPERRRQYDRARDALPHRKNRPARPTAPDTSRRWRENHPDYMVEWRAAHPDYTRAWRVAHPGYWATRDQTKAKARAIAGRARRKGVLVKQDCEICGSAVRVEAHHAFGYELPMALAVWWLCRQHHLGVHRQTNNGPRSW